VLTVKPGYVDTPLYWKNPAGKIGKIAIISADKAAADIWRAVRKGKQQMYTPWWWRYLMFAIIHTPSFIFRRLSF
jgi:short-subunit dehydrogenase